MDLFSYQSQNQPQVWSPLAFRMRPKDLDEIEGQAHLVGPGAPLRRMIERDQLHSMILYGPPGTGKTTLGNIIAKKTRSHFEYLKAVSTTTADIRQLAGEAGQRLKFYGQRTILFLDEIHRFNKAQQDALLPMVEEGIFILIGATTENPLYEINSALLSRTHIYVLEPLDEQAIERILLRALNDKERGLGKYGIEITEEALKSVVIAAKGDARTALNLVENLFLAKYREGERLLITPQEVAEVHGKTVINYDKKADHHYDTISAFIKSIRGSDPDATLFWLAVMLEGGEDPRFIARRLVIHAAEDIGLADPQALLIATAAAQAVELVGLPEARIPLAEASLYLALAPKSNSSKVGIDEALEAVRDLPLIKVPLHIADASHPRAAILGRGVGYKYPHDFGGYVDQQYLPPELEGKRFYHPSGNGREKRGKP
ncbi:MAG: replication-associated recombination protein A [Syntrophothermus sp.]|nr:replication-associated recombination protein A [Syntrophothermus sp.]NSW81803.1 replication-associated recombination protein A [Syntrophothermus sp.]